MPFGIHYPLDGKTEGIQTGAILVKDCAVEVAWRPQQVELFDYPPNAFFTSVKSTPLRVAGECGDTVGSFSVCQSPYFQRQRIVQEPWGLRFRGRGRLQLAQKVRCRSREGTEHQSAHVPCAFFFVPFSLAGAISGGRKVIGPQVEFPDVKLTRPKSRGTLLGGFKKGNLNTRSCGEHVEIAVSKNWIPFFVLEIKWLWVKNQWYLFWGRWIHHSF